MHIIKTTYIKSKWGYLQETGKKWVQNTKHFQTCRPSPVG